VAPTTIQISKETEAFSSTFIVVSCEALRQVSCARCIEYVISQTTLLPSYSINHLSKRSKSGLLLLSVTVKMPRSSLLVLEKGLEPDAPGSGAAAAAHDHSSTNQGTAGLHRTAHDAAAELLEGLRELALGPENNSSSGGGSGSSTLNPDSGSGSSEVAEAPSVPDARVFQQRREQEVTRAAASAAADPVPRPWYSYYAPPESHSRIQEIESRIEALTSVDVVDYAAMAAQGQAMLEALGMDTGPLGLLNVTMRAAGARARGPAAVGDLGPMQRVGRRTAWHLGVRPHMRGS
jgi:hypothetical protein